MWTVRSSHRTCSVKKGVFRNFAKFTGKHLCQSLFLNKTAGLTFFRTPLGDSFWTVKLFSSQHWDYFITYFHHINSIFMSCVHEINKSIYERLTFYLCSQERSQKQLIFCCTSKRKDQKLVFIELLY